VADTLSKVAIQEKPFECIKGTHKIVADTLSRLDIKQDPLGDSKERFLGPMDILQKENENDNFIL
jgi:hypothetical protein